MSDADCDGNRLSFTKDEIGGLRHLLDQEQSPWWKNYPLLVASGGFLLSLITSIVSVYTGHLKDVHDQQAQLSATVQSLQDLALKLEDVKERNKSDPFSGQGIINLISSQETTMLQTGADLAEQLGTSATSAELTSLADGLYGIGDLGRAKRVLVLAIAAARNPTDKAVALRETGFYDIRSGGSSVIRHEGDLLFLRATNLEQEEDLSSLPDVVSYLKVVGDLNWAQAYAPIDCPVARTHFSDGVNILKGAPTTPDFERLRAQAAVSNQRGIGNIGSCTPSTQSQ